MKSKFLPLVLTIGILFGFALGMNLSDSTVGTLDLSKGKKSYKKLKQVIDFISDNYVEEVDQQRMVDDAIEGMIKNLDPHTNFMPKTVFTHSEEIMQGNFQGIGVEFYIMEDTVMVVAPVIGGPSHKLGVLPGDRIVTVDGELIAGIGITNRDVVKKLKGIKGTEVTIEVARRGEAELLKFTIERDNIPLQSVDASFMVDESIGFIKVTRFSRKTANEFYDALKELKDSGLQKLIIDLRGNSGGYLDRCVYMVDQLLSGDKLIVYTEGRVQPRMDYKAERPGLFENGEVVVLIDEGSASASEIFAGAIQDWDRGTIIGRRSFGKGLVQHQYPFKDSSAIRLTVSRYYTPVGRSIQKPFDKGRKAYEEESYNRMESGELYNEDSLKVNDSLVYVTPGGDTVYGGGGITPDIFVPIDTTTSNEMYGRIIRKGLIAKYAYTFVSANRKQLESYDDASEFSKDKMIETKLESGFQDYIISKKLKIDNLSWKQSRRRMLTQVKASVAQQIWRSKGYYQVISEIDDAFNAAMGTFKTK